MFFAVQNAKEIVYVFAHISIRKTHLSRRGRATVPVCS